MKIREETNILMAKAIRICDLPDGYYKERLSEIVTFPERTAVFVVAVDGAIGDWACYIGWPEYGELLGRYKDSDTMWYSNRVHTVEQVAELGDKLSRREALAIFPEKEDRHYRE